MFLRINYFCTIFDSKKGKSALSMKKILLIDDDKISRKFLSKALVDSYLVEEACDGEEGLEKAMANKPDIILLDVEMPGMNGYEVCDKFRQQDSTRLTPVIFLSGRSSVRERMLGYESGGDDYLVKPCEPEELRAKINVLLEHREVKIDLKHQANDAQKTALVAMAGSSELGMALSFAEKSFTVRTYSELAEGFFQVTGNLGLSCCLHFSTSIGHLYFSSKGGDVAPLEEQLMVMLKGQGRIVDFGARTQVNYQKVSLLVKNMPLDNMEKYGRYKDLFPFMIEAAEARIQKMEAEHGMLEQSKNILMSFSMVEGELASLARKLMENHSTSTAILQDLREELEKNIPLMGLEDDQESYLVERIDTSLVKAVEISDSDAEVRKTFDNVLAQLETLMNQQRTIIDDVVIGSDEPENSPDESDSNDADNEGSGSVELF